MYEPTFLPELNDDESASFDFSFITLGGTLCHSTTDTARQAKAAILFQQNMS